MNESESDALDGRVGEPLPYLILTHSFFLRLRNFVWHSYLLKSQIQIQSWAYNAVPRPRSKIPAVVIVFSRSDENKSNKR